jgi:hypothetical protein
MSIVIAATQAADFLCQNFQFASLANVSKQCDNQHTRAGWNSLGNDDTYCVKKHT